MVEKKCETTFKLDILIPYHALQILLIKKIIFFLQPLLPPFQHCLFSPETLWPFPVFLWYCICTSISLFPVSHLILKTNKQTSKKQRISKKKMMLVCPVVKRQSHDCLVKFSQQFWFGIALIPFVKHFIYIISPFFLFTCYSFIQNKRSIR